MITKSTQAQSLSLSPPLSLSHLVAGVDVSTLAQQEGHHVQVAVGCRHVQRRAPSFVLCLQLEGGLGQQETDHCAVAVLTRQVYRYETL